MNFFGIGGIELIVIALVAFLVLGPRRMAEAGKTIARFMAELRKQRDELTSALLDEPPAVGRKGPALKDPGDFPGYRPPDHGAGRPEALPDRAGTGVTRPDTGATPPRTGATGPGGQSGQPGDQPPAERPNDQ